MYSIYVLYLMVMVMKNNVFTAIGISVQRSHLYKGTLDLIDFLGTIGFLVAWLAKALHPILLSLAGCLDLRRLMVVPNLFHLRMMEATVLLGAFNAADIFLCASSDLCLSRRSTDLMAWFSHAINCETLHRQMCAFY